MKKLIAAIVFLLALASCSASPEQPETPTAPAPTVTLPAAPSPTLEGGPVAEWKGIPIMSGALTGEGDEEGYVFTIRASSQQVQDYYQLELAARGWQSLSEESEGSSRVLVFIDTTSTMLTVRILTQGEEALVLLTK